MMSRPLNKVTMNQPLCPLNKQWPVGSLDNAYTYCLVLQSSTVTQPVMFRFENVLGGVGWREWGRGGGFRTAVEGSCPQPVLKNDNMQRLKSIYIS